MWTFREYTQRLRPHLREMYEKGWSVIDFPSWNLGRLAEMFASIMETESVTYLKKWEFFDSHESKKPDLGVVIRDPTEWNEGDERFQDDKAFFHYSARVPVLEQRLFERGVDLKCYGELLSGSREFLSFCAESTLPALAMAFDLEFPFYNFYDLMREQAALDRNTLRIVWYRSKGKPEGTLLAAEHTDRSLITIHPYMKYDGLLMGEGAKALQCHLGPGSALVFFGDKASVATRGFVSASKHRVVHTGGYDDNRTACIFFGHTDTPYKA